MSTFLPIDFVDRHTGWRRWWINLMVFLRIRTVKAVCCESFRKEKGACKGCATVYSRDSDRWIYRMIARRAKIRASKIEVK